MPFPMKIQPIDSEIRTDHLAKPVVKSRLKRLFERQFLRISSSDKIAAAGNDADPSSVVLDKMVQNFIEETNTEKSYRNHRCNCFHAGSGDSSDDDLDSGENLVISSPSDAIDLIKSLVVCTSVIERNLLADASKIVQSIKAVKGKEESRKLLIDGLKSLNYDAAICKSKWEKSASFPAGEYEYIDVISEGNRILLDIDFRSEFEVARSTKAYRSVLQSLPLIFVGSTDRVHQLITLVSEAAKQSLKKKGLHFPPWRKTDYMLAKWLAPYERMVNEQADEIGSVDLDLSGGEVTGEEVAWQLPEVKPKKAGKMVTGLASVLREVTERQ